ncbi:MAG: glutathione S-transferase family protein [Steroidobacter sp.]
MLTIIIGDKNLSSWSLRPWLVLKHFGFEFREIKLQLDTPEFKAQIAQYSGAARVPVLIDGETRIWDSLAIAEYLNDKAGGLCWPSDPATRAQARSVSAEMHSGFAALRSTWPMHAVGKNPRVPLTSATAGDVARVAEIWSECRQAHGSQGSWLFGAYSIADAMYAPVVLRFNHYGAEVSPSAAQYMQQTLQDEHLRAWIADAEREVAGS